MLYMKNVAIIAHRGGFLPEGPIPEVRDKYTIPENTLEAFKRALENGWGIETDVRLTGNGRFVLSHDDIVNQALITVPTLDELCQLTPPFISEGKKVPFIAFQIKRGNDPDSGVKVGRAVAQKMLDDNLQNCILFDATLKEAQILRREFPALNLSVSVGEANYSLTIYTPEQVLSGEFTSVYTSVWADEWKKPKSIYNERLFKSLRQAYPNGRIDVISPELHYEDHPLSKDLEGIKKLWQEIINWGSANGICTDYPSQLQALKSS